MSDYSRLADSGGSVGTDSPGFRAKHEGLTRTHASVRASARARARESDLKEALKYSKSLSYCLSHSGLVEGEGTEALKRHNSFSLSKSASKGARLGRFPSPEKSP